jgi:hypothetical protein
VPFDQPLDQPTPVIECIEALKVFDNCSDVVNVSGMCTPLPAECLPLPATFSVSCAVTSATCAVVAILPHVPADGLANVTFRIDFTIHIEIFDTTTPTPTLNCAFDVPSTITETVSLVAPPGFSMLYQCDIDAFTCGPCIVANFGTAATPDFNVCCEVELCLEIQSKFPVKLQVWTSGYCEPTPCRAKQGPTLICPPTPLFPPQAV